MLSRGVNTTNDSEAGCTRQWRSFVLMGPRQTLKWTRFKTADRGWLHQEHVKFAEIFQHPHFAILAYGP
jgi:hypothetical protein